MGKLQATEMANLVGLETGIRWHLQSNHYPPYPEALVSVAIKAVEIARDAINGDNDHVMRVNVAH